MKIGPIDPCPLCGGLAPRWQLAGAEKYKKITCPRCGTFILDPTLLAQAWARLDAEDRVLVVVFLPAYIRRQNCRNHTPLLSLGNWRALARRVQISWRL
jgi:RNase P subunit RPR2